MVFWIGNIKGPVNDSALFIGQVKMDGVIVHGKGQLFFLFQGQGFNKCLILG